MGTLRARRAYRFITRTAPTAVLVLATAGATRAQQGAAGDQDATSPPEVLARAAGDSWLELLDQGSLAESWDSAAAAFKEAVAKDVWEQQVAAARAPYEPFGERQLLSAAYANSPPNAPPGEYVVLQYETAVSGGRTVTETVVPMKQEDGSWRVSGYFVKPNQ